MEKKMGEEIKNFNLWLKNIDYYVFFLLFFIFSVIEKIFVRNKSDQISVKDPFLWEQF